MKQRMNTKVIQRRFSNVTVIDTEVCPCLEASMGGGGNNIPMIVQIHENDSDTRSRWSGCDDAE